MISIKNMKNLSDENRIDIKKTVVDRFLKYIAVDTQSDYESDTYPSTKTQIEFGKQLAKECISIGFKEENIVIEEKGYIICKLDSNMPKDYLENSAEDRKKNVIAFFAHMDTSPDFSGKNVNPKIVKYEGGEIKLSNERSLSPKLFKHLENYIGQEIIVTDGNTLLGADDKAGVAEIMTAMEYIIANKELIHNDIYVCFTPDEEVGAGVDHLDVSKIPVDFGFTIDGGELGELECENFNAAGATIEITGKNVHPGTAKDIMINSMMIMSEIISKLPQDEVPEKTEGYEGFFHVINASGTVENSKLAIILRDFEDEGLLNRKKILTDIVNEINERYKEIQEDEIVKLVIVDNYRNMKEKVAEKPQALSIAKEAMEKSGVVPIIKPIRGGTDGARLSFMGIVCPNIFTGGHNFHGPYEHICVESMVKTVEVIMNIVV